MKSIYKSLYPIGYRTVEVSDDFELSVPYTDVLPLNIENSQSQFFDWGDKTWKEAASQINDDKLNLLETLFTATTDKLEELEDKTNRQDIAISHTQIAVAEVFEQILSGGDK